MSAAGAVAPLVALAVAPSETALAALAVALQDVTSAVALQAVALAVALEVYIAEHAMDVPSKPLLTFARRSPGNRWQLDHQH